MESYDNINSMLSKLVVNNDQNNQNNNEKLPRKKYSNTTFISDNINIKQKPYETYTGFSRDMQLFSNTLSKNNLKQEKDFKTIANERLQNFEPIPMNSPYLSKSRAHNPGALNFQLDNFKKSLNEPDINERLNSREMIPATKQYNLNKTDNLPVFDNYPVDTNDTFILNNN